MPFFRLLRLFGSCREDCGSFATLRNALAYRDCLIRANANSCTDRHFVICKMEGAARALPPGGPGNVSVVDKMLDHRLQELCIMARREGVACRLTAEDLVESGAGPCHWCGRDVIVGVGSVDVVNPRQDLERGENLVPCCAVCRGAKGMLDCRDFVRIACNVTIKHRPQAVKGWQPMYDFIGEGKTETPLGYSHHDASCFIDASTFDRLTSFPCYYCGNVVGGFLGRRDPRRPFHLSNLLAVCGGCYAVSHSLTEVNMIGICAAVCEKWCDVAVDAMLAATSIECEFDMVEMDECD